MNIEDYFSLLSEEVKKVYALAGEARRKGLDPVQEVEVPLANSLAERVVGLVSVLYEQVMNTRIVPRILELEKEYGSLEPAVALKIAEEVAKEKYCKFKSHLEAVEAGIRIALGYLTLGYVSSPIEGFIQLKLKKTADGKDYFAPYYSGPIRSAGGTEAAFSLVVVDYLRELFGYAKYDPTEDEEKRGVHECYEYHERINNLQYLPSEQELAFLMHNLPIQLSGDPSEDKEVYNYKDLPRIETNFIRSGFALVLGEGLAQKAPKILKRVVKLREQGFKLTDWDWLAEFVALQKKIKEGKKSGGDRSGATYMQDIVAGRPIFAHPSRSGAFRLRYGRCRNTGYSTLALHPATMAITKGFISVGTQLKIEKPTKGCTIGSCDTIAGPIVKLQDDSVHYVRTMEEAEEMYPKVKEIIYLGDLLVPYGDFFNRNHPLEPAGYVEQYWKTELNSKGGNSILIPSLKEAIRLSKEYKIALHPEYTYFWKEISREQLFSLIDWIAHAELAEEKLILPYTSKDRERFFQGKRALELLGCPHQRSIEHVILTKENTSALLLHFGMEDIKDIEKGIDEALLKIKALKEDSSIGSFEFIKVMCPLILKDKSGTFIGARMGRPEKAKLRKLVGSPHVLFPVGEEGGRLRSVQTAAEFGSVRAEFPDFYCQGCKNEGIYSSCEKCGLPCIVRYYCKECMRSYIGKCPEHDFSQNFQEKKIDMTYYLEQARKVVGVRMESIPVVIKGVKGTSNKEHICENLAKGLLRAQHNINVNKDGTIRYDMTEMPITQFKPLEVGTSVERLKQMGYEYDIHGKELENEEQILEIFPHDIILPACPVTPDEKADDVFVNVSNFLDDELEKFYKLPRFFNASRGADLVGHLVCCMSPHTSATVVGRLIGFSKVQALLASPYIHAAMRRDCLAGNNYVALEENGEWKIEKIGEFIENKKPSQKIDIYGTLGRKQEGLKIWSNPGKAEVEEMTKHSPTDMIKIYLEDGRIIETTKNHKLFTKGKMMKPARELELGDKLMVAYKREIEEKDIKELFLPEIFKDREDVMIKNIRNYMRNFDRLSKHDNFVFRDSFPITYVNEILKKNGKTLRDLPDDAKIGIKGDNVVLPINIPLNNDLLEVMGLYISEGHARKNQSEKGFYQISISGKEVKKFVKDIFMKYFGIKTSWENDDSVTFSSKIIYELFVDYLKIGHNARAKRIPSKFLNLKKEKIASLLRGYYEGDGSVSLSDIRVSCDSVSEGLKNDLSFVLSRFGIYTKYYEYEKEPGQVVKDFYIRKSRAIPKFKITKINVLSDFVKKFKEIGFLSERKNKILSELCNKNPYGTKIEYDDIYAYPKIIKLEEVNADITYCFNVKQEHNFFANDILVKNCDGDEAAVMLLMDLLLNFSRKFLPSHRGGTQDAPLVLNMRIRANEVDDMIFDVDTGNEIPLALYEAAEVHKHPSDVKMEQVKKRLGTEREFIDLFYSYDTSDINHAPLCSSYKTLPTMDEKVQEMMRLCGKIRAVDISDVARLVIERHFIRDTKGNLRKFSQQGFRCVGCNEKFRRPPLVGKCTKCGGKIIFTISEGSILKYMQPALNLARDFKVQPYLLESLELTQMYIQSIFGKEKEKQQTLF